MQLRVWHPLLVCIVPSLAIKSDALLFHNVFLPGDDTLICAQNPPVGYLVV
jgi:hypothetical protein